MLFLKRVHVLFKLVTVYIGILFEEIKVLIFFCFACSLYKMCFKYNVIYWCKWYEYY